MMGATCHTFFLSSSPPPLSTMPSRRPTSRNYGQDTEIPGELPSPLHAAPPHTLSQQAWKWRQMWRERDAPRWVPLPAHPANSAATTPPRSVSASQDCERHENGLDTPPNAVSTHHLSVDGQQTWTWLRTDVKNCENHLERQIDQNTDQDNPCEYGQPTPPWTSPLPLSCWGMRAYTKHRSRESTKQGQQGYPMGHCWQPPWTQNTPGRIAKMHMQYDLTLLFWAEHQREWLEPTSRTQHWYVRPNTDVSSWMLVCTAQTADSEDLVGTQWHRHCRGPKRSWGGGAISPLSHNVHSIPSCTIACYWIYTVCYM